MATTIITVGPYWAALLQPSLSEQISQFCVRRLNSQSCCRTTLEHVRRTKGVAAEKKYPILLKKVLYVNSKLKVIFTHMSLLLLHTILAQMCSMYSSRNSIVAFYLPEMDHYNRDLLCCHSPNISKPMLKWVRNTVSFVQNWKSVALQISIKITHFVATKLPEQQQLQPAIQNSSFLLFHFFGWFY